MNPEAQDQYFENCALDLQKKKFVFFILTVFSIMFSQKN